MTLAMNLLGGWLTVGLIAAGFPELHGTLGESAHHFLDIGLSWQGAALAVLAGAGITLTTRMQAGADEAVSRVAASVAGALVLAGGSLFHSVLDSVIIFGAIHAGVEGVGDGQWLAWVWWVIPLNILGGLFFTTLPRVLRSTEVREQEGV